jgi:photosystem II stability/assembly factor-like uncharacterized protein
MPWTTNFGTYIWINAIFVDPAAPSHVIIGTYQHGLYKSTDGGASWNAVAPSAATAIVNCIVDDGGSPDTIYACAEPLGVLKSTDGGDTWSTMTSGLSSLEVTALAVDKAAGSLFALTRTAGVFRSDDKAQTWKGFDTDCLPSSLIGGGIAVVQNGNGSQLVAGGAGGVVTHAL